MAEVINTEIVISMLGRWYPGDLAFIESLEYSTHNQKSSSTMKLVGLFQKRDKAKRGWPSIEAGFYRVALLFNGIKNLFITDFGLTPKQIMGFDIIDISDSGWENVNFKIEDYENNQIGFLCNSVEILLTEKMEI